MGTQQEGGTQEGTPPPRDDEAQSEPMTAPGNGIYDQWAEKLRLEQREQMLRLEQREQMSDEALLTQEHDGLTAARATFDQWAEELRLNVIPLATLYKESTRAGLPADVAMEMTLELHRRLLTGMGICEYGDAE